VVTVCATSPMWIPIISHHESSGIAAGGSDVSFIDERVSHPNNGVAHPRGMTNADKP